MFEDVAEMEREIETFRKNVVASSELVEGISQLTAETKKQKESFSASTEELLKKLDGCIAQFKNDHESALRALSDSNGAAIETLQKNMSAEQKARIADLETIQIELQKNLADATAQADAQVKALSTTSEAITSAFHEDAERIQNLSLEQIKQLNTDCDRIIAETKSVMEAQQKVFNESLLQTEEVIKDYQSSVEGKYAEFCSELQSVSADQIRQFGSDSERMISEMKETLDAQQKAYVEKLQEAESVIQGYQSAAEAKYSEFVRRLETTNVDQIFKEVQDLKKSIQSKFLIMISGIGITLIVAFLNLILK